jgi:hypothetical protein
MAVPVRGARVRRSRWFREITHVIEAHGFQRGAPNHPPCPGFHYYSRSGIIVQILPETTISVTRPDGSVELASSISKANFILSAIVRYIEGEEEHLRENLAIGTTIT